MNILKIGVIALMLSVVPFGPLRAQVRYVLASPNQEISGDFGYSVSGAGDVNNDGYDDLIVGAYQEDPAPSPVGSGRAHVFNGRTGSLLYTLISPHEEGGSHFGYSVAGAGDVNNDGYADIIVSADWEEPDGAPLNSGRAYVFSGATGLVIHELMSPNPEDNGEFGHAVAGAGDANNDGFDDVVVAAWNEGPGMSPDFAGRVYVFSGQTGLLLHTLMSPHEESHGYFGISVDGAGDLNGDNFDDIIVGAYLEDPGPGLGDAGRAYVFSGSTGDTLFTLVSPTPQTNGRFGISVSKAGDVNNDSAPDIVVGAYWEDPGTSPYHAGRAHIFAGPAGTFHSSLASPLQESGGYFGYSVSWAGDIDEDGSDDLVVGAPREGPQDEGRGYFFLANGCQNSLLSPNEDENGQFGFSVSGVGDADGDGYVDIVVGAYQENPGESPLDAGRAYVFSPGVVILTCELISGELQLQWSPWLHAPPAQEFWIYGAANESFFVPGIVPPYDHRLDVLPATDTSWSTTLGIGDTNSHWSFCVVAATLGGDILYQSNRVGEWDFGADLP